VLNKNNFGIELTFRSALGRRVYQHPP
jgi:hypothetical protein